MWLTSVEYFGLTFNTSWPLVFCIDMHVCTISKVVAIKKEKEICLSDKEYKSGHK